jgi:DNA-binding XRE family transcriptional regulator
MNRTKGVSFDAVLKRQLRDKEIRIAFEERRFYLQVARLVADLRARSGMSQARLAKTAGVTQPLIARLERGDQRRTPTFETLFKILKALGYQLAISIHPDKHARAA